MKVERLSALRTDRLYPPENIPGTHFCWRLNRPQCHSVAGMIMSMKNSNDTIGDRTRDLPAWGAGSNLGPRKPTVLKMLPVNWDFCFWDLQVHRCRHNLIRAELPAYFAANPGASSSVYQLQISGLNRINIASTYPNRTMSRVYY